MDFIRIAMEMGVNLGKTKMGGWFPMKWQCKNLSIAERM